MLDYYTTQSFNCQQLFSKIEKDFQKQKGRYKPPPEFS